MMRTFFSEKRRAASTIDSEHREALLSGRHIIRDTCGDPPRKSSRSGSILLTVLGVIFTTVVAFQGGRTWEANAVDVDCTQRVHGYSPLLQEIDVGYSKHRFNGTFLKENIYRKPAAPEVDEAWEALGINYRAVAIPHDEALKAGIEEDFVKINQKYGGGYFANIEGLHQLHCLNLVRQSLYYNFEYYHSKAQGPFSNSDHIIRLHVSHCLDIIRQQLMCTLDLGVLGQVWWNPDEPEPFVDFNTKHKCKNYEAVRKWAEAHQVPEDVPDDYVEPPKKGDRILEHVP